MTKTGFHLDADLVLMLQCYLGHVDYLLYMKINSTDIYNKSVKESKSSKINKQTTSNRSIQRISAFPHVHFFYF